MQYILNTHAVHIRYICSTHDIHLQYTYSTYSGYMEFTIHLVHMHSAVYMQYTYSAQYYICSTHAVHKEYTCSSHEIHSIQSHSLKTPEGKSCGPTSKFCRGLWPSAQAFVAPQDKKRYLLCITNKTKKLSGGRPR